MSRSYLQRTGHTFYARFRVPDHLRRALGRSELKWSLQTGTLSEAKHRITGYHQIFVNTLRLASVMTKSSAMHNLSNERAVQIQDFLKAYVEAKLRQFRGYTTGSAGERSEAAELLRGRLTQQEHYEKALKENRYGEISGVLSEHLGAGMPGDLASDLASMFDDPSELFQFFAREACNAELRLNVDMQSILGGSTSMKPSPATLSPTLSHVVDQYIQEKRNRGLKEKSIEVIRTSLQRLVDFIGEKPVGSITRQDINDYLSALQKYPARLAPAEKGLTFSQVIERHHDKTLSDETVNKHLGKASELFKWATIHSHGITKNPAESLQIKKRQKANEERDHWSDEDMTAIFSLPQYSGDAPFAKHVHYWAPLISAYSTMRAEEICQLDCSDITIDDGVYIFNVNDDGEKSLKSISSRRKIPVHSKLIELGLISYKDSVVKAGLTKLFPTLTKHKMNGYSHNLVKWFSETKKKLGFNQMKTFHSFRHSAITRLKWGGVQTEMIQEIDGHALQGETQGRYGKDNPIKQRKDAIEVISYPISPLPMEKIRFREGLHGKAKATSRASNHGHRSVTARGTPKKSS